jgi:F0F1-type ATP synthase assembly protein I
VRNSIHHGRRLAWRVTAWQLAAAGAVAAVWLVAGRPHALAALLGGALVALGTGIFALRYFGQQAPDAGSVIARLVAATVIKWVLVIGGVGLALGRLGLPPLPLLCGLGAALLVNVVGLRFKQ